MAIKKLIIVELLQFGIRAKLRRNLLVSNVVKTMHFSASRFSF